MLINISDHHTRTKVNGPDQKSPARVVGVLLGQQMGRTVDIRNSFEVGNFPAEATDLDFAFLHKKLEQCESFMAVIAHYRTSFYENLACLCRKTPYLKLELSIIGKYSSFIADKCTFPQLDVVGWYATGAAVGPTEMEIQRKARSCIYEKHSTQRSCATDLIEIAFASISLRLMQCFGYNYLRSRSNVPLANYIQWVVLPLQIMELNESPVLLLLDPTPSPASNDLPVALYESGTHLNSFLFSYFLTSYFGL